MATPIHIKLPPPTDSHLLLLDPSSTSNSSIVSVATLREMWERFANENGWVVVKAAERGRKTVGNACGGGGRVASEKVERVDDDVDTLDTHHQTRNNDNNKNKKNNNPQHADTIVCALKTYPASSPTASQSDSQPTSTGGAKIHEIHLKCLCCESSFVLTAAHECDLDLVYDGGDGVGGEVERCGGRIGMAVGEAEDGCVGPRRGAGGLVGGGTGADHFRRPHHREPGLEWLRDGGTDYVNIIM
ncbi:hypothetical protein HK104_000431 [Borealophlyctis nickersoniae]|nr:hypothetical protein HK104_000431 [Borealophlyctis nickersoniae]